VEGDVTTDLNELDCTVYIEAKQTPDELATLVCHALSAQRVSNLPGSRTIHAPEGEVEVRKNRDADKARAREFPDGFLYFTYALELYFSPTTPREARVHFVSRILDQLWSRGFPAVAACDYEEDLPSGGGYKNTPAPWTARTALPAQVDGNGSPSSPPTLTPPTTAKTSPPGR
jgi:hypothetical protein